MMPGIIGFQNQQLDKDPQDSLQKMAAALVVRQTDVVSVYSNDSINLGSVRLGNRTATEQPVWNEDGTIAVVMAGEIFGYHSQAQELQNRRYNFPATDATKFVVSLYAEEGEDFVRGLNGAFAIAIWDARQQKLILVNDRLGYEPLYYTKSNQRFAFASGVRGLLADPTVPRNVNLLALSQFLTFDHVLGTHTFLQDVQLLPPGSILTLSEGRVSLRSYWDLEFPTHYSRRSERDLQEETLHLLRQAVSRQQPDQTAGILLSGGLDSRYVLALLAEKSLKTSLMAFTFGNPDCDDLRYARELAKQAKIPHVYYPLRSTYLMERAEQGIVLTDGMENVVHMHTLDTLAEQAGQAPILYKGFLGDALSGYFSYRDLLGQYTADDLMQIFFERYPIVFNPTVHAELFTPRVHEQVQDTLLQTTRREFMPSGPADQAANLFFRFDVHHRQRRLTLNGVQLVRSQAVVRTPFYDNDVVDFMLRLPQGYRLERHMLKQSFIKAFPEMAKIPYTETGYPMMACRRDLTLRLNEHIRWRLRAAGFKNVSVPQKRHYASYNNWFRSELREWAEGILTSELFKSRGLFKQAFVQNVLEEHISGKGNYQKLGALLSIELWHRKFID